MVGHALIKNRRVRYAGVGFSGKGKEGEIEDASDQHQISRVESPVDRTCRIRDNQRHDAKVYCESGWEKDRVKVSCLIEVNTALKNHERNRLDAVLVYGAKNEPAGMTLNG